MREIKFRTWSGPWSSGKYRMIYSGDLKEEGNADNFNFDNGVLMQYTGLKDKNGREIYEGDILFNENTLIHPVTFVWDEFFPAYLLASGSDFLGIAVKRYGLEVIGNIYENPELLGGSNGQSSKTETGEETCFSLRSNTNGGMEPWILCWSQATKGVGY